MFILISSCKEGIKNPGLDLKPKVEFGSEFGRSSWQKPQEVIDLLDSIQDKTIVDIGAGTGYFTFRLALKGAKVIAVDIDPDMIELLETFRANLPSEIQSKITTRLVPADDPRLENGEADGAIIINTIAYISNKVNYLKKVKSGLKKGSKIIIVDFKTLPLPINAPPMDQRYSPSLLEEDLLKAGFKEIRYDDDLLDHQYVIVAAS